jgi:hypothetical protein
MYWTELLVSLLSLGCERVMTAASAPVVDASPISATGCSLMASNLATTDSSNGITTVEEPHSVVQSPAIRLPRLGLCFLFPCVYIGSH